jgi:hypothetical protein
MKMAKHLQNYLHGYETTKKHWIGTVCFVLYGTEITFIDFNPNEFSVIILTQFLYKSIVFAKVQNILKTEQP